MDSPTTFVLLIEMGNDEMQDREHLYDALKKAASEVMKGGVTRPVVDGNGNKVGYWAISPQKLKVDFSNRRSS